jgi:hypothetical protein
MSDDRSFIARIAGTEFSFDLATYREIDGWIDSLELDKYPDRRYLRKTVDDLGGLTLTFMAVDVSYMAIVTPESRRFERQVQADLKEERIAQGFVDDD